LKRKRCDEFVDGDCAFNYEGLWVFDDAAVGLSKEPFIAGIDSLIDKATANIPSTDFARFLAPDNFPA
jgi:hypothetical protein